jgi:probable phosphoglycerate mutase
VIERIPQTEIVAHIDGASRGNPGPAAYGVVVKTAEGESLAIFSKFLGQATNNVAEYQGLLAALDYALKHRHTRLRVMSDSELLTRQIGGKYKVKSPDLKPLHQRAVELIGHFAAFSLLYLPREQNREADRLANRRSMLRRRQDRTSDRPLLPLRTRIPSPCASRPLTGKESSNPTARLLSLRAKKSNSKSDAREPIRVEEPGLSGIVFRVSGRHRFEAIEAFPWRKPLQPILP